MLYIYISIYLFLMFVCMVFAGCLCSDCWIQEPRVQKIHDNRGICASSGFEQSIYARYGLKAWFATLHRHWFEPPLAKSSRNAYLA